MSDRTCWAGDCDIPVPAPGGARGLCAKHYKRWKLYGDPLKLAERQPKPEICIVEGCDKPARTRNWCIAHYDRWLKTGDLRADVPLAARRHPPEARCAVEECGNSLDKGGRGWCRLHYDRWRKHGDPLAVAFIRGDDRARIESFIDRSGGPDACHPWTGGRHVDGYGWTRLANQQMLAHMAAWELENGPKPAGIDLDHECHNQAVRDGLCRPGKCPHRLCCNLRHVVPRTRAEHVAATDLSGPEFHRGRPKLTESQVRELRALMRRSGSKKEAVEIASRFGISHTHAMRIKNGKRWGWLADASPRPDTQLSLFDSAA